MNEIISYGIKVALFHGFSCAAYWFLFRKSDQFTLNRLYLISTVILGFIAPMISLPVPALLHEPLNADVVISAVTFTEANGSAGYVSSASPVWNYSTLATLIYLAGVLILTVRCLSAMVSILRIRARATEQPRSDPKIYRINEAMSFSFINTIFLQHSAGDAELLHEKGHVEGRHWIDLIFMEFVTIIFWINPFVWLYRSWLRQVHEYLADEYVLRQGVSQHDYLLCILESLPYRDAAGPASNLNSHSLKQRIFMMTKTHLLPFLRARYIAIVPVIALAFFSFTNKNSDAPPAVADKVLVIDAAHGGTDAGATSSSGITEKEVALAIANYAYQIGKEKGLNVIMTRTTDQQLSLQDRIDISTNAKADVFLSVHAGFDNSGTHRGPRMYVSEQSPRVADSKKVAASLGKELKSIKGFDDAPVGTFDALVLKNNAAASVILEVGFLSDEKDARFISDPANQKKIAEKIIEGIVRY